MGFWNDLQGLHTPENSHLSNERNPQNSGWWMNLGTVNYNISLTWIVRPFGDHSPNYDYSEGGQGSVVIMYPDIMVNHILISHMKSHIIPHFPINQP